MERKGNGAYDEENDEMQTNYVLAAHELIQPARMLLKPVSFSSSFPFPDVAILDLVDYFSDSLLRTFCQGPCISYDLNNHRTPASIAEFQLVDIPALSLPDYFTRIVKLTNVSAEAVVLAMIQIGRVGSLSPDFPITPLTIHRLLFASIVLASKYWDDNHMTFKHYSEVSGIPMNDLKLMELDFCVLIQFEFVVSETEYAAVITAILSNDLNVFVTIADILRTNTRKQKNSNSRAEQNSALPNAEKNVGIQHAEKNAQTETTKSSLIPSCCVIL